MGVSDSKRHRIFFPEGKGFIKGWTLLAEKLRGLGIKGKMEARKEIRVEGSKTRSYAHEEAGKTKEGTTNGVWLDVGDCGPRNNWGILQHNLVGSWKTPPDPFPSKSELEVWARKVWRLKGELMVAFLNDDLLLLEFSDPEEARWVLEAGRRSFKGEMLQLDWWNPDAGCVKRKDSVKEAWMRVVGLPLHLWTTRILKLIGDSCGGFLAVDKKTTHKIKFKWARILVKLDGKVRHILAGSKSFEVQLWWEIPPWSADVYPSKGDSKHANQKWERWKEEDEGFTRPSHNAWVAQDRSQDESQIRSSERITRQVDKVWAVSKLDVGQEMGFGYGSESTRPGWKDQGGLVGWKKHSERP